MIRAIIADDEPLIREFLRANLAKERDVRIVAECGDGDEAIEAIRLHPADVVFLDVQMPGCDGFSVIGAVGADRMPLVVFVTAFDEYAIQAFEVHAFDYLLKPFDADRIAAAIARVRDRLDERTRGQLAHRLEQLLASGPTRGLSYPQRIPVRNGPHIDMITVADIDWIEAESNYVTVHAGKRSHVMRETLSAIERRLDPTRFVRVHRSFLVNVSRIARLNPLFHGEYQLVLADGTRIASGRTYSHVIRKLIRSDA